MKPTLRTASMIMILGLMFCGLSVTWQPTARAQAQAPTPTPTPSPALAPTTPPEMKALTDAQRISDPQKKVEAFEKFIADYPKSSSLYLAHQLAMNLLIKKMPEQKNRILFHAEKFIETIPAPNK